MGSTINGSKFTDSKILLPKNFIYSSVYNLKKTKIFFQALPLQTTYSVNISGRREVGELPGQRKNPWIRPSWKWAVLAAALSGNSESMLWASHSVGRDALEVRCVSHRWFGRLGRASKQLILVVWRTRSLMKARVLTYHLQIDFESLNIWLQWRPRLLCRSMITS